MYINSEGSLKKHATCIIIALKLIILQKKPSQGWRKRIHHHCNSCNKCESWKIQKPRMKKHTNEPMILPKPLQMRASSTLTNPFITSAENDSSNVSPANDDAQNSSHIHQQADEAPKPFNFGFNFV